MYLINQLTFFFFLELKELYNILEDYNVEIPADVEQNYRLIINNVRWSVVSDNNILAYDTIFPVHKCLGLVHRAEQQRLRRDTPATSTYAPSTASHPTVVVSPRLRRRLQTTEHYYREVSDVDE